MKVIITTVGTSLLTNAKRKLQKEPEYNDLINFIKQEGEVKASAETNSLHRILESDDHIIFLHSDTPEGEICARVLAKHYESKGYKVSIQKVDNLNYRESRFKIKGLRSLVSKLCELIEENQKKQREVVINATGGFKAEIAYATLVGLLYNVPVYYIHELFKEIIELPSLPVSWDISLFLDNREFFEWLEKDLRTREEVESRLKGIPERDKIYMLLYEEEGYFMLSPAGEAFYKFALYRFKTEKRKVRISLSDKAQKQLKKFPEEEVKKYIENLTIPEWRIKNSESRGDYWVAPRGHKNLRIIYTLEGSNLKIHEIMRHDEYERRIKST